VGNKVCGWAHRVTGNAISLPRPAVASTELRASCWARQRSSTADIAPAGRGPVCRRGAYPAGCRAGQRRGPHPWDPAPAGRPAAWDRSQRLHVRGPVGRAAPARVRHRPALAPDTLTSATSAVGEDPRMGPAWPPECPQGPVRCVRISSLSWSLVMESNRRPSPYHACRLRLIALCCVGLPKVRGIAVSEYVALGPPASGVVVTTLSLVPEPVLFEIQHCRFCRTKAA
jgi:hypothetical protein